MKIGTDKISDEQKRLLTQARSGSVDVMASAFVRVIQDEEIREETEELHPDWQALYELKRDTLRRFLPDRWVKEAEAFFESLGQFDQQLCELDLVKLRTTFLLGAGASKPAPSNIPTVRSCCRNCWNVGEDSIERTSPSLLGSAKSGELTTLRIC
jgi:hypothetical protein